MENGGDLTTVAPTPRQREFRRTGFVLDGIPLYHVVTFQLYFGRFHLIIANYFRAELCLLPEVVF